MLKNAAEMAKITSAVRKAKEESAVKRLSATERWVNNEVAPRIEENATQGKYWLQMPLTCPDVELACIELKHKGYKVSKHPGHILIVWGKLG